MSGSNKKVLCLLFLALLARSPLQLQGGYAAYDQVSGTEGGVELPVLFMVQDRDGNTYSIVDHARYVPGEAAWNYRIAEGTFGGKEVNFLTNETGSIQMLYLVDEKKESHAYVYSGEEGLLYPCFETEKDGRPFYYMSPHSCAEWPQELTLETVEKEFIVYGMDQEGKGGFYRFDQQQNLVAWDQEKSQYPALDRTQKLILIFLAADGAILAAWAYEARRRHDSDQPEQLPEELLSEEESEENCRESLEKSETPEALPPSCVVSVQDVTMVFRIATGSASSIKEFLIQWVKRQVKFRELVALDHVSFDVRQGEVVGIIGTNGSGKSTLLRIISGALNPTQGKVVADRRKVQLLTLGAGFDMELSARENLYLNGALIGCSKEFLDSHYEKIVEFAELEGFMEEKVKNFSSGMVSRLGFSIATARDAAEILILDEVLSVGDEFFRKKSLNRIKEMIHGGSTVIMVSHGMGTILDNCTKVVWIEKGILKMAGEPREVCEAYRKQEKS